MDAEHLKIIKLVIQVIKENGGLATFRRTPAFVVHKAVMLVTKDKHPELTETQIYDALDWIREKLESN